MRSLWNDSDLTGVSTTIIRHVQVEINYYISAETSHTVNMIIDIS